MPDSTHRLDSFWPSTEDRISATVLEQIAADSATADERGVLFSSTIDRLRGCHYFGLPVPSSLAGGGAGLLECAAVQRRLAMADPALAIATNMHLFSVGMAVEHWARTRDACGLILEAIATQGRIVASAFAEPGLAGSLGRSNTKATRADGGYLVSGVKSPCSLAEHCDLLCFQMEIDGHEPERLLTALIPARSPGVHVERTWDSMGMRASGSDTVRLEKCFVPNDLVFHRCETGANDDPVFAAGVVWFCVTTTATYLGVAHAAIDLARVELSRARVSHLDATRAELPSIQGQLGEAVAGVLAVDASCAAVAAHIDSRRQDPRILMPIALGTKHIGVDACIRAVEAAAELVGGTSYRRTSQLARLWRDVQAARYHPPTRPITRQMIGRWALGLSMTYELNEHPQH